MARYIAAGILGCLYAIGSYWIVSRQGEAYRDALRRERIAASRPGAPTPSPIVEGVRTASEANREPESSSLEPEPAAPPPGEIAARPDPPAKPKARSATAVVHSPTPRPHLARTEGASGAGSAKAHGRSTKPTKPDPLWEQPAVKKIWDLAHLSASEESLLGQDLHELIVKLIPTVRSGPWLARVEAAAEPFIQARSRKDIEYSFTILDSDGVNAFSTPGGYIYVSRGLFNIIGEEDDSALEFAVGHEIAHVDLQHALKCLQDPEVQKWSGGTLEKLYGVIIPFAYTDPLEYEADRWVYRKMKQLGRTPSRGPDVPPETGRPLQVEWLLRRRGKPELKPDASLLENHLRAHTAPRKRLKELEIIEKAADATK